MVKEQELLVEVQVLVEQELLYPLSVRAGKFRITDCILLLLPALCMTILYDHLIAHLHRMAE